MALEKMMCRQGVTPLAALPPFILPSAPYPRVPPFCPFFPGQKLSNRPTYVACTNAATMACTPAQMWSAPRLTAGSTPDDRNLALLNWTDVTDAASSDDAVVTVLMRDALPRNASSWE